MCASSKCIEFYMRVNKVEERKKQNISHVIDTKSRYDVVMRGIIHIKYCFLYFLSLFLLSLPKITITFSQFIKFLYWIFYFISIRMEFFITYYSSVPLVEMSFFFQFSSYSLCIISILHLVARIFFCSQNNDLFQLLSSFIESVFCLYFFRLIVLLRFTK